jgi:hypothetical protein
MVSVPVINVDLGEPAYWCENELGMCGMQYGAPGWELDTKFKAPNISKHANAIAQLTLLKSQAIHDIKLIPVFAAGMQKYDLHAIDTAIARLTYNRNKLEELLKKSQVLQNIPAAVMPTAVMPTAVMSQSPVVPQAIPVPSIPPYQDRPRQPYSFQYPPNKQNVDNSMSGGTWAMPQQVSNSSQQRAQTGPPNRPPPPPPTRKLPQPPPTLTRTTSGRSTITRSRSFRT